MRRTALIDAPWREPSEVLSAVSDLPWTIGLLTGGLLTGGETEWSYVMAQPSATLTLNADDPADPIAALRGLAGPAEPILPEGPPFQGGVAGLLSYDLADRFEPSLALPRHDGWPDLAAARYEALLAFDPSRRRIIAVGRGAQESAARAAAQRALGWLDLPVPRRAAVSAHLTSGDGEAYEDAVSDTIRRIAAGEIFQANVARRWEGLLTAPGHPIDVMARLSEASPAPYAAYLRLPDRALVSNSPEQFLKVTPQVDGPIAESQPIKGTARRSADPAEDAALAAALAASPKDRAENLMIVDLMRNDLARVSLAGTVQTPQLFRLATFANVHHLVSRVIGRLSPGKDALDLLRAAFPPGSITGAPKVQAMKLIAELEGARGPFFGSMFWLGADGAMESSVLIRTAAFVQTAAGWRVEARAGAGLVADSDPGGERAETEAKISALAAALSGAEP